MKINSDEPIGLMYISSYIKQHLSGVKCEVFDWHISMLKLFKTYKNKENIYSKNIIIHELEEKIKKYKPDVVGISALYELNSNIALEVAKIIKDMNKDIIIVMGGMYATTYYQELKKNNNIDYVVYGEGEYNFYLIIKSLLGYLGEHEESDFAWCGVKKLDSLPLPDRSTIPIGEYSIIGRTVVDRVYKENCRVAIIQISRGCPQKCSYCSGHTISNRNYRTRSIESIVDEIKMLQKKYDIEVFLFNEENPSVNMKHTKELYKALMPLNIKWISNSGFYVSNMDKEFAELAIKSGLLYFNLAFESGSKRMLKIMNKSEKIIDNAENVMKWIRDVKNDIYVIGFYMFGFVDETWQDVNLSIEFMKKLDLDWYQINMLQAFKGSSLYEDYKEKGYLKQKKNNELHYIESTIQGSIINPKELSDYIYKKVNIDLNFKNNRCMRVGNYAQVKRDMAHILNITNNSHVWAKKILDKINKIGRK